MQILAPNAFFTLAKPLKPLGSIHAPRQLKSLTDVYQRGRGIQKELAFSMPCRADQRQTPPLIHTALLKLSSPRFGHSSTQDWPKSRLEYGRIVP